MEKRKHCMEVAAGRKKAELVIKNVEYLNVFTGDFLHGDIAVESGLFAGIGSYEGETELDASGKTVVPGFIDAHIHLESSMLLPQEFARVAVPHGTCTVVTDPHEIVNVTGTDGLEFMLQTTENLPLDVFFMMPSCVPCSCFDESGGSIGAETIAQYLHHPRILGLAEMMNYPGVIGGDKDVWSKIEETLKQEKLIDGHAPMLNGLGLNAYIAAGISSDHECSTAEEAVTKLRNGQWIMIREGTATKNLKALLPLFQEQYYRRCMLACDDKHPEDLQQYGHIDGMIRQAIAFGAKAEHVYAMASFHAASYFGLKYRGAISPGYVADFVILDDYKNVSIHSVYKSGCLAAKDGILSQQKLSTPSVAALQRVCETVHMKTMQATDFMPGTKKLPVIGLIPGEIITSDEGFASGISLAQDILKAAVIERHKNTGHIGICYMKGYGLTSGAVATSIAHDSHNVIVIGTNESDMAAAANCIQKMQGGIAVVENGMVLAELELPVAGLMSKLSLEDVVRKIETLKTTVRERGVNSEIDPFMTLSFTCLPVIPQLKLTTKGVVDVSRFKLV